MDTRDRTAAKWAMIATAVFLVFVFWLAFSGAAKGGPVIYDRTQNVTFSQSVLDSAGLWYGYPDSIWIKIRAADGTDLNDLRLTTGDGRVSADPDDSALVFTDQWQDIDGDGGDSLYNVTITTGYATGGGLWVSEQHTVTVEVREWWIPTDADSMTHLVTVIRDSLPELVTATGFSTFNAASDSVIVDGSSFADLNNAIDATVVADGAITVATMSQATFDKIGFYVLNHRSDTAYWVSGADSSFAAVVMELSTRLDALNNFDPSSDSVIVDVSAAHAAAGLLAGISDSVWDGTPTRDLTTPNDYKADVSGLSTFDNTSDSVIVDVSSAAAARGLAAHTADSVWDGTPTRDLTTPNDYKADVSGLSTFDASSDSVIVDVSAAHDAEGLMAGITDSIKAEFSFNGSFVNANIELLEGSNQSSVDLKDFADNGYDPAGDSLVVYKYDGSSAGNDSLQIRRWVWDSTSGNYGNYARVVDTSKVSEGASATVPDSVAGVARLVNSYANDSALWVQTYQRIDSVADTINAHAPHDDNFGGTGNATGTGSQLDSILVLDTSGTSVPVAYAKVSIYADGYSGSALYTWSDANGWVVFNLDASTDYDVNGVGTGYIFDSYNMTTGSGGTFKDTLMGYNIAVGSPSSASLKRVYDYEEGDVNDGRIRKAGFKVVAQLVGAQEAQSEIPRDTVANLDRSWNDTWETKTDTSGYWFLDVPVTSYLKPGNRTDSVFIKFTMYEYQSSTKTRWETDEWLYLEDTDTDCLTNILNGTGCP